VPLRQSIVDAVGALHDVEGEPLDELVSQFENCAACEREGRTRCSCGRTRRPNDLVAWLWSRPVRGGQGRARFL